MKRSSRWLNEGRCQETPSFQKILDGKSIDYMNKGEARIAFMLEKAADDFRAKARLKKVIR